MTKRTGYSKESEIVTNFLTQIKGTNVSAVWNILATAAFAKKEIPWGQIRIEKKVIRIQEMNPDDWEDQDGGRHVKDWEGDGEDPGTQLRVKDADGGKERFQLRSCSTYKRNGDWIIIEGEGVVLPPL